MREPDPVEIVAIAIPLLAEAVAVTFFIAIAILIAGLRSGAI
jgi:hypothetical protein